MRAWLIAFLAGLLLAPLAEPVKAGAFSVVPQLVRLAPDGGTATVELRNNGPEETVFQVETFAWEDSTNIADLLPTRSILAVPAVFRLAGGESQVIRVALRGDTGQSTPGGNEQSYRLLISEVPPAGQADGVVFALRMNLPVFVTPPDSRPAPFWRLASDGSRLSVTNQGDAHLRLGEASLREVGSGELLLELPLEQPAYLLPGRSRSWSLAQGIEASGLLAHINSAQGQFRQQLGAR